MTGRGVLGQGQHLGRPDAGLLALLGARRRAAARERGRPRPAGPRGCDRAAASARRGRGRPARPAGRAAPGCARTAGPRRRTRRRCRCRRARGSARRPPRRRARRGRPAARRPRGRRRGRSRGRPRGRTSSMPRASSRSTLTCAISGSRAAGVDHRRGHRLEHHDGAQPAGPGQRAGGTEVVGLQGELLEGADERPSPPGRAAGRRAADAGQPGQHDRVRHGAVPGRAPRKANRGWGAAPSTRSATSTPSSGANLAPWPEQGEAIDDVAHRRRAARSSTKSSSEVIVNRQLFSTSGSGSRPGRLPLDEGADGSPGPVVDHPVAGGGGGGGSRCRTGRSCTPDPARRRCPRRGRRARRPRREERRGPASARTPRGRGAGGGRPRPA